MWKIFLSIRLISWWIQTLGSISHFGACYLFSTSHEAATARIYVIIRWHFFPLSKCKQNSVFFQGSRHSAESLGTSLSARSLTQPLGICAAAASEQGMDLRSVVCVACIHCHCQAGEKTGCCYTPPLFLRFSCLGIVSWHFLINISTTGQTGGYGKCSKSCRCLSAPVMFMSLVLNSG